MTDKQLKIVGGVVTVVAAAAAAASGGVLPAIVAGLGMAGTWLAGLHHTKPCKKAKR